MKTKTLLISFLILIIANLAYSQDADKIQTITNYEWNTKWQVDAKFGSSIYYGDSRPSNSPFWNNSVENKGAFAFGIKKQYTPAIYLYAQFTTGNLASIYENRNTSFKGTFSNYSLGVNIDLIPIFNRVQNDHFAFLLNFGIGAVNYRSYLQKYNDGKIISLVGYDANFKKVGKANTSLTYPIGLEFAYKINKNLNLNLEYMMFVNITDDIDGLVSGQKSDLNSLLSIGISYKFSFIKKEEAPKKQEGTINNFMY